MRVVHVSVGAYPPVFSTGGGAVQRRVAELARAQAALGHDVTVLSPDRSSRTESRSGVRVEYLGCRGEGPLLHWEFLMRVRRALTGFRRPDVVHVHNEPEGAVALGGLAESIVLSYDNFDFRQGLGTALHAAYRRLLLRYDLLLPVSEYCARQSAGHWRLPAERLRMLPNGVDTQTFAPRPQDAARERAGLGVRGDLVLYLGRICRQKGTHILLDALPRLRETAPRPVHLVLVGPVEQFDGRDRPAATTEWRRAIQRVGAGHLGAVPDDRLPGLLSAADVFVMPTIELEMQGMAALEAQACGTPVVATDHGGLPDTVPDDCGVRVPAGDSTALAQAVAGLLADGDRRSRMAHRARRHAEAFDWARLAGQAVRIYRDAGRASTRCGA